MDIKNEKLNVENAFRNYFYVVPDYQREYVWQEKQVHQLLEDIYEEFQENTGAEYFIGSIVVCKNQEQRREVIDGQQRLTTLFLILCAFKKSLKNNLDTLEFLKPILFEKRLSGSTFIPSYKLILQYERSSELLSKISEGDLQNISVSTVSAKNIRDAYEYILKYLESNFKTENELIAFLGYLSNKVNFIQIETPDISNALKIFETINERGIGLNPMDLLKNLIFRQVTQKDFQKVKKEWKNIIDILDKDKQKHLRFLRYCLMANYDVKNKKGEAIVREDEIYEWITHVDNKTQCTYEKQPFEFIKLIDANAKAYVSFTKGLNNEKEYNVYLDNIKKLSGSFSQHLILLLAAKDLDGDAFNHLSKQLETLIFYYIITKTSTRELEGKFSKWSKELRSISEDTEKQKERLNEFIINKLKPEITSRDKLFDGNFKEFNYHTLQQYRLKYILAKFAQYIDLRALGQREPDSLDNYLRSKIEIEHILPDKPTIDCKTEFEQKYGEKSYDTYKLKLGNLTLLEKPINGAIGRDYYRLKKEEYKKSTIRLTKSIAIIENVGKDTSINRINQELRSFDEWNKESIDQRQEMLLRLAKKIWRIEELQ